MRREGHPKEDARCDREPGHPLTRPSATLSLARSGGENPLNLTVHAVMP